MKLLIQRVCQANVVISQKTVAEIGEGLLVLVGFGHDDNADKLPRAIDKLLNLRVFSDSEGRFQYSCLDQRYSILAVPQFTLYASTHTGRRPEFTSAMPPGNAAVLFKQFCELLQHQNIKQAAFGEFGADMQVSLVNDGPVTLLLEL